MPRICAWASEAPWAERPIPLLMRGDAASVKLHAHVCCLAANPFLLNIRCLPGALCFSQSHSEVSMHKILSLIAGL